MSEFRALIFDLDDTLLDTSRLLVPQAERESCAAMIQAGLNADLESCLKVRKRLIGQNLRTQIFEAIVREFGVNGSFSSEEVAQVGSRAFYEREVENHIYLEPEVIQLLAKLKSKYDLYLVTSGAPKTQKRKVEILKIENFFKNLFYVDLTKGETKAQAFREIHRHTDISTQYFLSIGDRIDTDVADAKSLGMRACWVAKGEYAQLRPLTPLEEPDYRVNRVIEIESVCRL